VVPLRSIEAHLGETRYSCYSFLTSALEGGEWSASRPGRALPPEKEPPIPTVQEAGRAPQPVSTQRLEEKSSTSVWDGTPAVQSLVRHYTDWATEQRIFPLTSASRPAVGPTQSPVQRVSGALSPGVKRGRGVMLTTHRLLVPRLRKSRNYTSCYPKCASMERNETILPT
jgi:hypothetical protein